jgi:hypothetical protein
MIRHHLIDFFYEMLRYMTYDAHLFFIKHESLLDQEKHCMLY